MRYVIKETDKFDAVEFLNAHGFICQRVGDAISFNSKEKLFEAKAKYPHCFSPGKPIIDLYDALQGDIVRIVEEE